MKILQLSSLSEEERGRLLSRSSRSDSESIRLCENIFEQVEAAGDQAVRQFTARFDGVDLERTLVSNQEFETAAAAVGREELDALRQALGNIEKFHRIQCTTEEPAEINPGVRCWREKRPVDPVGLYVPAGNAPLPSTLLMLAVPARLAGCRDISVCVPPRADGSADPHVLAAARLLGISSVHKIGGAQAVAALVFGTQTVTAVAKIVGPGSRIVQSAKALAVQYGVAIDLLAGPSEILVVCDGSGDSAWIAADLISQAEHSSDSRAVLVTTSNEQAERVRLEVSNRLIELPRREIAAEALERSFLLVASSLEEALEFSNDYAPEHLVLQVSEPASRAELVRSAGSVFLGPYSPVTAGDYASGTNHTLPTSGTAAGYSGVSVDTFERKISFQELSRQGLATLAPTLRTLARMEGLEGHARAVECRLEGDEPDPGSEAVEGPYDWRRAGIDLADLPAYEAARMSAGEGLLLDANESPFDAECRGVPLNRYPDPRQQELRRELGLYLELPPQMILAGCGSDEVLDWLIRACCRQSGDAVAVAQPTYSMYEILAASHRVEVVHLQLDEKFDFRAEDFLQRVTSAVRILFLCSPNNPTGNRLRSGEIEAACRRWQGLVVVDEAYVEFAQEPSLAPRIEELPNLAVVRTLSKAWGRASLRVGYLVAHPEIVKNLERIKAPYNLGGLTMALAMDCLRQPRTLHDQVRRLQEERSRIRDELEGMPGVPEVFPSEANFILFRCENAGEICARLRDTKIVVRDRSGLPGLAGTIRVTVGKPEENSRFLSELKEVLHDTGCQSQVC